MSRETRGLFEMVPPTFYAPEMRGVHAIYRFEIDDGEKWTMRVDDGTVSVGEAGRDDEPASCTIGGSDADVAAVLRGEQNMVTALLQGRISVLGDLAVGQRLVGALFIFGIGEERSPAP